MGGPFLMPERGDMDIKSAPLQVKAAGPDDGLEDGQFVAYASVFGNVDSYGDIVDPGAFKRTLGDWEQKGATIPVLWGHDMSDPFANIGGVLSAEEDDHGLKVTGSLDLENPTAAQVYKLLKGRRVNTMSFAYSVLDSEKSGDGLHLKDLDLFEVSIVPVPANDQAEVLAVKAASEALVSGLKAGRAISSKNESELRAAHAAIGKVLSSLGDEEDQTGKASDKPEAKPDADDEASDGKSSASGEELKAGSSVELLAAQARIYALIGAEGGSK